MLLNKSSPSLLLCTFFAGQSMCDLTIGKETDIMVPLCCRPCSRLTSASHSPWQQLWSGHPYHCPGRSHTSLLVLTTMACLWQSCCPHSMPMGWPTLAVSRVCLRGHAEGLSCMMLCLTLQMQQTGERRMTEHARAQRAHALNCCQFFCRCCNMLSTLEA